MAKKEVKTDLWVARQLDDSKIKYDAQGSDVKEINDALQSASKRGTGNAGYPEYVAVVKDFVIVIEDKADLAKHQKLSNTGILSVDQKDIADYAVNGAYFYAKHIAQNSSFHKIFAIGVSGDEKHHKITPLYVDDRDGYKQLPDIESFTSFTAVNIDEYYTRYVLAEKTDVEKTTEEILKDAAELHEYLRTYGSLKDQDKPLVVSGILLALDDKFFKPDDLLGDETTTDGQLIYDAIQRRLKASNVGPDAKRDKLMSEFSIIRTSARLNEVDAKLGKTPLKFYTEFLKKNVFDNIKYRSSSEDFIGRFYGEFMRYSGGDGQTLGIVLTPRHICDLFCDLLNIQTTDIVLDPCCGTAGFLVAAMHHMLEKAGADQNKRKNIKKKQLHGFELQSNMFAIAATNMILRDDGNSNIKCEDEYKPDYQYMASYSNQKRLALLEKYRVYAKTRIAELGEPMEIPAITQKKWEPVLVSDIFDILSGKRLVAADTTPGDRPFIGALDNSNGIARFVNDTNVSLDKNVLGVNYDGNGMVIGFYHPYECIFSDSVKRFHLKNHEDKAFVLLFMKVAILQQKSKFGYLYKFNAERMANTKIMLPVTDDGAPDYEYMEQYAKNLMLRKYKQYLSYLDSKEKTDTVATDN